MPSYSKSIIIAFAFVCINCAYSCLPPLGVVEKYQDLPESKWNEKKTIINTFTLADTTQVYKVFLLLRYGHHYAYKNIWVDLKVTPPNDNDSVHYKLSLPLADDAYGWLGSGMNNLYENRIFWQTLRPKQAGNYTFEIRHLMEDMALNGLYSVGIRIER